MIIENFDISSAASLPAETQSPLVVDSNTVLPSAIALQRFELIAWRRLQVAEHASPVQVEQLPPGDSLDEPEPPDADVVEESFDILVAEGANHILRVLRMT